MCCWSQHIHCGPKHYCSIKLKLESTFPCEDRKLEFEVLFNDIPSNDFDTLFHSLPPERNYLFPKASVHFLHSSYAFHWLSSPPRELDGINKGSILYHNAPKEVLEAYQTQFASDTESFLAARAEEVVPGGIMAILLCSLPNGVLPSECEYFLMYDFMKASLLDMVETV